MGVEVKDGIKHFSCQPLEWTIPFRSLVDCVRVECAQINKTEHSAQFKYP